MPWQDQFVDESQQSIGWMTQQVPQASSQRITQFQPARRHNDGPGMVWPDAEENQLLANLNSQVQGVAIEISSITKQIARNNNGSIKLWEKQDSMERDPLLKFGETNKAIRNNGKDTTRSVSDIKAQVDTTAADLKRAKSDLKSLSNRYTDDHTAITDNLVNYKVNTRADLQKLRARFAAVDKRLDGLDKQVSQILKRINEHYKDFRKEQTVLARLQARIAVLEKRQSTQTKDIQHNSDDCKQIREELAKKTHNRQNIVNATDGSAGFQFSPQRGLELNQGNASPTKGSTVATAARDNINRADLDTTLNVHVSDEAKEKLAASKPGKIVANSRHIIGCLRRPNEIHGLKAPGQALANADNWIEKKQQHLGQPLLMAHHFKSPETVASFRKQTVTWAKNVAEGTATWCIHGCSPEHLKPIRRASTSSGANGAIYAVCGKQDHGHTYSLLARPLDSVDNMPVIDLHTDPRQRRTSVVVSEDRREPDGSASDDEEGQSNTEIQTNDSDDDEEYDEDGSRSPSLLEQDTICEQILVAQESEELQEELEEGRKVAVALGKKRKAAGDLSRRSSRSRP